MILRLFVCTFQYFTCWIHVALQLDAAIKVNYLQFLQVVWIKDTGRIVK